MRLSRHRRRAVYRVYSEDEYLAGVDPFADWSAAPAAVRPASRHVGAARIGCEPWLRRLAGAAALTGAVGTVGVTVGLAGRHTHSAERREVAERVVPSLRMAVPRPRPRPRAGSERVTPRPRARWSPPRRRPTVGPVRVALVSRRLATHPAVRARAPIHAPLPMAGAPEQTPAPVVSAVRGESAPVAITAQSTPPVAAAPQPRAQSEFGFER